MSRRTIIVECDCAPTRHYSKVVLDAQDGPGDAAYVVRRQMEALDMACAFGAERRALSESLERRG